jgi:hypothetical protein
VVGVTQGGRHVGRGCVEATTASYLGGGTVHACGADARQLCRSTAGSSPGSARGVIALACRRAGLRVSG